MSSRKVFLGVAHGEPYVRLLGVAIESLLNSSENPRVIVEIGDVDELSIETFKLSFPSVEVRVFRSGLNSFRAEKIEPSGKVSGWNRLLQELEDGEQALFFDADVLFTENFSYDIFSESDLTFTVKSHKWPLNSGVVAARASSGVRKFFEEWLATTETLLSNPDLNRSAYLNFGAADQAALALVFERSGINKQDIRPGILQLEDGTVVSFEPCEIWNEVRSSPITNQTKIIHFKTAWHRILFRFQGFYHGRPEETSREMYDAWRDAYRLFRGRASDAVMRHLAHLAERWEVSAVDYMPRGILNSELAIFLSSAKFAGATIAVESGRAYGHSTRVLAKNFEKTRIKFFSVELNPIAAADEELSHLFRETSGGGLIVGDSREEIPKLLHQYPNERFAILIDGPKGTRSIDFARRLAAEPNVFVIAVHDLRAVVDTKPSSTRNAFENSFELPLFSDSPATRDALSQMDAGFRKYSSKDYLMRSLPGYQGRQYIGSYGPTLGIVFPDFIDRERMSTLMNKQAAGDKKILVAGAKFFRKVARILTNPVAD